MQSVLPIHHNARDMHVAFGCICYAVVFGMMLVVVAGVSLAGIASAKVLAHGLKSSKMQTVAEILAGSPDDAEWEDLDPRAIEAAQWTDREINKVIEQVKLHGTQNDQGLWQVTFGKMFTETAQIFDALSGILKTSKKYKVLDFAGEQLWQGQHDDTVITLVNEVYVLCLCEPILLPSGTISQGCQAGCTAGVVHHHLTLGVTHAAFAVTVAGILASKSDVDGKLI
eukprot:m.142937 g.142937  ORF g.142937 m.142937 type:complete len:226 (+) comp17679_c0_seq41:1074-1751(+)